MKGVALWLLFRGVLDLVEGGISGWIFVLFVCVVGICTPSLVVRERKAEVG